MLELNQPMVQHKCDPCVLIKFFQHGEHFTGILKYPAHVSLYKYWRIKRLAVKIGVHFFELALFVKGYLLVGLSLFQYLDNSKPGFLD